MEMKGEGGHRTSRLEGPGIRIQVGKGRIAFFDLRQPGGFVSAYAVSVRAFEHRAEPIKRPDMLLHPRLRVVLRGDRRNQEGPVRCLQEEELSRELRQDSTRDWTLAPANRPRGLDERIFRAIHFLPNPARVVIQPDPMMTALAPRAFREAPIPRGVHPAPAMKFQVGAVPGISVVRTPDLDTGPRVPSKDRHLPPAGRSEFIRFIRRKARSVAGCIESSFRDPVVVGSDWRAAGDQVRADEEEP